MPASRSSRPWVVTYAFFCLFRTRSGSSLKRQKKKKSPVHIGNNNSNVLVRRYGVFECLASLFACMRACKNSRCSAGLLIYRFCPFRPLLTAFVTRRGAENIVSDLIYGRLRPEVGAKRHCSNILTNIRVQN